MRILEGDFRTGAKLPNYPSLYGALGQYPPLYGTPKAADLITYIDICFGPKGVPGKDGYVWYNHHDDCPGANCVQKDIKMDSFKEFIKFDSQLLDLGDKNKNSILYT